MILLLGVAFLAGLVTILAPCMWPMLPIVLSSTVQGRDHRRPLGIVIGVMISFAVFTLSISYLVKMFHIDPNIFRLLAVVIIICLGFSLLIPRVTTMLEGWVSRLTGALHIQAPKQVNDFRAGLLTGLTLGIVWSPCGGPILASIAVLATTGQVHFGIILVTLAYVIGIGIPLFAFTYGGQQLVTRTRFISRYTGRVQQVFGIIMILTAVAIYFNYDKLIQLKLLQAFPPLGQTLNGFESSDAVRQQLDALKGKQPSAPVVADTSGLFNANTPAPDFAGITKWLNTDKPFHIQDLKGKAVLVDFWTYTCINCIRTLPHVTSWYDAYKDQGFVVIGVHTPEFEFEKNSDNVLAAIRQFNIHYPVPQDNNFATWRAYHNEYWPAEYLIDAQGNIRRAHFGEGEYDQTEMAIRALLQEAGHSVTSSPDWMPDQTPQARISPETYLGSRRAQFYFPAGALNNGTRTFTLPPSLDQYTFALGGNWTITDEQAIAGDQAELQLQFTAQKVFLVLRPGKAAARATVKVLLDGKAVSAAQAGADVHNGVVTVDADRLYRLIDLKGKAESHTLQLKFETPGIEAFAFTFG